MQKFLSTPSARRATITVPCLVYAIVISIHALREEGDMVTAAFGSAHILFLSTPSARRATWYNYINKSTRPIISIHALREEGDWQSLQKDLTMDVFLSTPSARRAT